MISRILISICILLFATSSIAQELFVSENDDGKWGFVNAEGKVTIDYQYEKADCYYMGYAAVVLNGKTGLIDLKGKMIIPCEYDNDLLYFEDGLAVLKQGDKYGYADEKGQIIIPLIYDEAEDCSNGKCHVRKGDLWLYLDKNANEIKE